MKTCSKCQQNKDLASFHKDSNGKLGRKSRCKERISIIDKNRYSVYEYRTKQQLVRDIYRSKKENKEKIKNTLKKYRARPDIKEKTKIVRKIWASTENGKLSVSSIDRGKRARRKESKVCEYEKKDYLLCLKIMPYCIVCKSEFQLSIDHVIPASHKGDSCIENYQTLCKSCNSRKKDTYIDYRPPYIKCFCQCYGNKQLAS